MIDKMNPLRFGLKLAIAIQLLSLPAAFSQSKLPSEPRLPTLAVKDLFTLPPGADCGANTYTPLWSGGGKIFVVWRDSTMHPMVTAISEGGQAESVPLDPNPKYIAQYREMHHSFSLGLDKKGYLHITGDMNGYPGEKDKFQPPRYRNKIILYWRSKSPYSVKDGFEFLGGDPSRAIPGTKWSNGAFYADNNGELYYMSRVLAVGGAHSPPEMGIGLYRYDTTNALWSALGAAPAPAYKDAKDADYHPVLFWGLPSSTETNREARGTIRFDKQNRLHFSAPAAMSAASPGMDSLFYACSDDGGKTWKKAGGAPIASLPLRAIPGSSQCLLPGGSRFEPFAEVAADENGSPAIACNPSNLFAGKWRFWEQAKKKWTGELPYPGDSQQENRILLGADGMLTFESVVGVESYYVTPKVELFRTPAFDQEPAAYLLPNIFRICGTDEYTLRKSGLYRTLLFNGKSQLWTVSQVNIPAKN